jgi:Mrp family chromosome partitioning ATPase
VAMLRHGFDGSVRRAQDLEAAGAEVLGVVPESKAVASWDPLQDPGMDGPRDRLLRQRLDTLWAALLPTRIPRDFRTTIAIVGDDASGATTLALHFAVRAASCHQLEVLLVETNYRHPTLAARLDIDEDVPGFADLIGGDASRADVVLATEVPGLRIVHAGAGDPPRRPKAGPGFEQLLRSLSDGAQVVVLDVPSIVEHPQFMHFLSEADLVVPVFAAGRSTKEMVRRFVHAIESAGKRAPGAILNRWRSIRPFWLPRSLDV